ncbi:hypothetical protein [Amycolatopsis thermoflava]|uniref:hypothetical protein n=1 Tax=Amycolatopsis thermoflava TaxID=84480 RepID=UPI003EB6B19B
MFVVYCETCDTRTLMGIDEVEWVHNLTPGVISVTTACPRIPDRIPPLWVRAYRHPAKWWARLLGRLLRKYEIQRDLHESLYRF